MYDLKQLLMRSIEEQASDVHFTVGRPPCYRVDGVLSPIEGERLTPDMLRELLVPIMEERHKEELSRDGQTDFAYAIPGVGRFRVNVFHAAWHICIGYAMSAVRDPGAGEPWNPKRSS